jgi:hypothetical protein
MKREQQAIALAIAVAYVFVSSIIVGALLAKLKVAMNGSAKPAPPMLVRIEEMTKQE